MSPFGAWLLVFRQFYYTITREEIFYFVTKICRIYAAIGVSQTPNYFLSFERSKKRCKIKVFAPCHYEVKN